MKRNLSMMALGLLTAASGTLAYAQTAATTGAATDHPTPVGTSQQTADQANRKATQEGGMATVVRTGPSAADHLRNAKNKAKAKAKDATADDSTTATGTPKQ